MNDDDERYLLIIDHSFNKVTVPFTFLISVFVPLAFSLSLLSDVNNEYSLCIANRNYVYSVHIRIYMYKYLLKRILGTNQGRCMDAYLRNQDFPIVSLHLCRMPN